MSTQPRLPGTLLTKRQAETELRKRRKELKEALVKEKGAVAVAREIVAARKLAAKYFEAAQDEWDLVMEGEQTELGHGG